MPSHGHYQNEAAELSRHKTIHESEPVLYETAIGSISGKTVITTTDTVSAIPVDDLMLEHISSGLRYRVSSRWRHGSFGQAGTTSRARRGEDVQGARQEIPIFYHDTKHHDGDFHDQQRRFIILLLA